MGGWACGLQTRAPHEQLTRALSSATARPHRRCVLSVDQFPYSIASKQRGSALPTSRPASISPSLLQTLLYYLLSRADLACVGADEVPPGRGERQVGADCQVARHMKWERVEQAVAREHAAVEPSPGSQHLGSFPAASAHAPVGIGHCCRRLVLVSSRSTSTSAPATRPRSRRRPRATPRLRPL